MSALASKTVASDEASARPSAVLAAELPARWGRLQRLKNGVIYVVLRAVHGLLAALPFRLAEALCVALGALAGVVAVGERRRALVHLAQALPELGPAAHHRIVRAMFVHFGRSLAELTHMDRFVDGPHAVRLSDAQRALFDAALAEGKGAVAVTGHIGNWELLAQVVARAGYPTTTIAKPLYDPRLTRWVHAARTRFGLGVIWRGDSAASKEMLGVFRKKAMLALLIDQDTRVQGAFVPFFGRPAHTPTAAASLALRFQAPVVVSWAHRVGGRHELHVERLDVQPTGNDEADTLALTAELNRRLEGAIRAHPEQWVWMHRRWKQRPPVEVA